ncbi:MAG: hypothetical protein ACP5QA_04880 [Phycisphaerae bacterium]
MNKSSICGSREQAQKSPAMTAIADVSVRWLADIRRLRAPA